MYIFCSSSNGILTIYLAGPLWNYCRMCMRNHYHDNTLYIYPLVNCTALECDPPPPIQNGNLSTNGVIVSSIAEYSCNDGYVLVGNDSLMCIQGDHDTFWSGTIPSCDISGMTLFCCLHYNNKPDFSTYI